MSYGPNFKKIRKGVWRNKKTGQFTSEKYIKGARTMSRRKGGSIAKWQHVLSKHYRQMGEWESGDRYTEPVLEY